MKECDGLAMMGAPGYTADQESNIREHARWEVYREQYFKDHEGHPHLEATRVLLTESIARLEACKTQGKVKRFLWRLRGI